MPPGSVGPTLYELVAVQKAFKSQPKKSTKQTPLSVLHSWPRPRPRLWWSATGVDSPPEELRTSSSSSRRSAPPTPLVMARRRRRAKGPTSTSTGMEKFDGGLTGDYAFIQQLSIGVSVVAKVVDEQAVAGLDLNHPSTKKEIFKAKDFRDVEEGRFWWPSFSTAAATTGTGPSWITGANCRARKSKNGSRRRCSFLPSPNQYQ